MTGATITADQRALALNNVRSATQNWYGIHEKHGIYTDDDVITHDVFLGCAKNAGLTLGRVLN